MFYKILGSVHYLREGGGRENLNSAAESYIPPPLRGTKITKPPPFRATQKGGTQNCGASSWRGGKNLVCTGSEGGQKSSAQLLRGARF